MRRPHILVIPYPVQGHVLPLMSFSQYLAQQGIRITFINTEHNHTRIIKSFSNSSNSYIRDGIELVSIPDGLEDSPEDRSKPGKLSESVLRVMPKKVEELIKRIILMNNDNDNGSSDSGRGGEIISCVVADQSLGWAMEVAKKFGIRTAAFCPAAAASMVLGLSIQKLIDDGIIDIDGTPRKNEIIKLSPGMPAMETAKFVWVCLKNKDSQRNTFQLMLQNNKSLKLTDLMLCNSVYELEPTAFGLGIEIQPVGPIGMAYRLDEEPLSAGSFWPEDRTCLDWLDQQRPGSVIYVAFGSFGLMDQAQIQELVMGLELTNRPFLWATSVDQPAKCDLTRPGVRGHVVKWAPQWEVLAHRAVGCFVSHCGWNSTMEGAANGVPFLCWPYFADQFINKTYICDVWRIGLGFERDEKGVILSSEVKKKVDEIMGDEEYKRKALKVKEIMMRTVGEGGTSYENLKNFVGWIKEYCR